MRKDSNYTTNLAWLITHNMTGRKRKVALAALDVHQATVFGRCEATTGIEPFHRLVDQVMSSAPYRQARRVLDRR